MTNSSNTTKGKTKIISAVLTPAIKLWLRSQVEKTEGLELKIDGGDGQIMRGHIPQVYLAAQKAIYQGLYLSQVQINSHNIRINLGQILKGKALRLLEPIFIQGEINLAKEDLQASLASSLLAGGLKDLLVLLLEAQNFNNPRQMLENYDITWQTVEFSQEQVSLRGMLRDEQGTVSEIYLSTGLKIIDKQILTLESLKVEAKPQFLQVNLTNFPVDLGEEVEIYQFNLTSEQLSCQGKLTVKPDV